MKGGAREHTYKKNFKAKSEQLELSKTYPSMWS
jgi:hypothetical protein